MILLCFGFYFLFPACKVLRQIQTEKNTPYELTAVTESSYIDWNSLTRMEGVERISPVLRLNAVLSAGDFQLRCEIKAVYSSFPHLKFTEGTMYPDSSNMPFLVLNEAAAKSFSQGHQTTSVSPEDTLMMDVGGEPRKAVVCGIFEDGSEAPVVYMSYDAAQKETEYTGQAEFLFLLEGRGAAEDVVSALQRQNIHASLDPGITLAWELLQKQFWQTGLLSFGLTTCAVVLIREKRTAEKNRCQWEAAMLYLSGLTVKSVSMIYPLRIVLLLVSVLLLVLLAASLLGEFSFLGIGVGMPCAGVLTVAILTPQPFEY